MKQFTGFPIKSNYTPLPDIFFASVLPDITDLTELKVTLHLFRILYPRHGFPKFVTFQELLSDFALLKSLGDAPTRESVLHGALELAVKRGTILHLPLDKDSTATDIYLLNTEPNRQIAEKIRHGESELAGLQVRQPTVNVPDEPPDVFRLYEENIGMLTPLVADELRAAEKLYPPDWIRDAIREAVVSNKRKWNYIERVLERWNTEGKSDGTHRRYLKENPDPDKYIKGKYGHIVRR